jgi:hypothetical protein
LRNVPFVDDQTELRPIGLDGVPRISRGGRIGLQVGLKEYWESRRDFLLDYDEIANINNYRFRFSFDLDEITIQVKERTLEIEARFDGKAESR